MSKRRRKVLPKEPVRCEIETLSHDGRGIAVLMAKPSLLMEPCRAKP